MITIGILLVLAKSSFLCMCVLMFLFADFSFNMCTMQIPIANFSRNVQKPNVKYKY